MKNLTLIISLLPSLLLSQVYVPFISSPDSSDTWMDINSCTDFSCYYSETNRYTFFSDTIINGLQYAKFYVKTKYEEGADQSQWCNEFINYYDSYVAIRENNKKVYVNPLNSTNSTEYLAYDFNLNIGDTVPDPRGGLPQGNPGTSNPSWRIINSIDSVFLFGAYRKRYVLDFNRYIIEGVGASTGLFNIVDVMWSSDCHFSLQCYSEQGTPDYFITDCNINLGLTPIIDASQKRELIKIVDYLGRETKYKPNTFLIYIYSNGETEKVFNAE